MPLASRWEPSERFVAWATLAVSIGAALLAILSGVLHDYRFYVGQWAAFLDGPARSGSEGLVYGPLYLGLAPLYAVHPLLPKLVFAGAWVGILQLSVREALAREDARAAWVALVVVGCHPLLWVHVGLYGNFDVLVAGCCLAAAALMARGRSARAGASLAAGVLLKIYPVALGPFLAFRRRTLDVRFALAFTLVVVAGVAAGSMLPGVGPGIDAVSYAADRPSTQLSIFRVLRGALSPVSGTTGRGLDSLSLPLVVVGGASVWGLCLRRGIEPLPGAIAGLLTVLTFYKVGNAQLHIPVIALTAWWIATDERPIRVGRLRVALTAYFSSLAAYVLLYEATRLAGPDHVWGLQGGWTRVREVAGIPSLLVNLFLVAALVAPPATRGTTPRGGRGSGSSPP